MKRYVLFTLAILAMSGSAIGYNLIATDHSHDSNVVEGIEVVDSHSGGTNDDGCHNNHKTGGYHCH